LHHQFIQTTIKLKQMKKVNLIFAMLISAALVFTSCTKETNLTPDAGTDGQGSYSLTIDGVTYTKQSDAINMALGIAIIPGIDNNGNGFTFTVTNPPSVGGSANICHEDCPENSVGVLFMGEDGVMYTNWDGTVSRPSLKKIELSGNLLGGDGEIHPFTCTINLNVIV